MNTAFLIRNDENTFGLGGGSKQVFRLAAVVATGCLLFVVSRKLTWGVDEPLLDWRIWSLSIVPYFLYLAGISLMTGLHRLPAFVKFGKAPIIWTVSLALYVFVHATALSRFIEDPIYDGLNVGLASFALLTFFYVTVSAGMVSAFGSIARRKQLGKRTSSKAVPFSYALCLPLFLLLVFYVPLQS